MPRARKKTNGNGNGKAAISGMSPKHMKRKKPIDSSYMVPIKPLTPNQLQFIELLFYKWH